MLTADLGATLLSEITDVALTSASEFYYFTPGASLPLGAYWGTVYDTNSDLTVSFTPAQCNR